MWIADRENRRTDMGIEVGTMSPSLSVVATNDLKATAAGKTETVAERVKKLQA